jgi:glucan phosphoethanolaminetransferase (alkaline phosphatase superfamily)
MWKGLTSAAPAVVLVWVNDIIGVFDGSRLTLRQWQPEADLTVAALSTLIAIVVAAVMSAAWRWIRVPVAVVFLATSLFLAYRCNSYRDTLDANIPRNQVELLSREWEHEYILMLICFVVLCRLLVVRSRCDDRVH